LTHPGNEYLDRFFVYHSSDLAARFREANPNGVPDGSYPNLSEDDLLALVNCRNKHLGDPLWTLENMQAMRELTAKGVTSKELPPPSRLMRPDAKIALSAKDEAVMALLRRLADRLPGAVHTEEFKMVCAHYAVRYNAATSRIVELE
jgi:hypothetical protein